MKHFNRHRVFHIKKCLYSIFSWKNGVVPLIKSWKLPKTKQYFCWVNINEINAIIDANENAALWFLHLNAHSTRHPVSSRINNKFLSITREIWQPSSSCTNIYLLPYEYFIFQQKLCFWRDYMLLFCCRVDSVFFLSLCVISASRYVCSSK